MSVLVVAVVLAVGAMGAAMPTEATSLDHTGVIDTAPAADDQDDVPADFGNIIGSPSAGPDPEHSGDRGGWAQLVLLAALVGAVGFISWRVSRALRVVRTNT